MIPQAGLRTPLHRRGWTTSRLKFLLERHSRPVREDDGVVTAFRDGVVTLRSNRREDGFTFADKEIGYQGVEPGDLVIHAMDGFAGAIGVSDSRGKCSPVYSIATARADVQVDMRFWAFYIRNLATTGFIESLAKGIRERSTDFRWKDAGNLLVNFPDLETQKAIADFLDRETARIDQLIEKKQRLVELATEKQHSRAEKLVTFGPSDRGGKIETGNVWLPYVGSGTQLLPIKRVSHLISGYAFSSDDLGEQGTPVLRIGDVRPFIDIDAAKKFTGSPSRNLDQFLVQKGDILIAMTGATTGKFGVFESNERAYINQRVGILRARGINSHFLTACLGTRTFVEQMKLYAYGGAQPNIGAGEIGSIVIPVPPVEVQDSVAAVVSTDAQRLASITMTVQASIDRLREFRSALITAAVSGQIDVATWSKRGPADAQLDRIQAEFEQSKPEAAE